jgi:hypothetical protein
MWGSKCGTPTVAPQNIALLWATHTAAIMAFEELFSRKRRGKLRIGVPIKNILLL